MIISDCWWLVVDCFTKKRTTNKRQSTTNKIMAKIPATKQVPKVHKDLQGLDVKINTFGEIKINLDIDRLNDFLNKNVDDKKLRK